jgi:hypothetical protein
MFPKPKREVNRKILDNVKKSNCIICGRPNPDPDHILSIGAGGDDSLKNVWPLCRNHHTQRHSKGLVWLCIHYPAALRELRSRGFEDIVKEAETQLSKEIYL